MNVLFFCRGRLEGLIYPCFHCTCYPNSITKSQIPESFFKRFPYLSHVQWCEPVGREREGGLGGTTLWFPPGLEFWCAPHEIAQERSDSLSVCSYAIPIALFKLDLLPLSWDDGFSKSPWCRLLTKNGQKFRSNQKGNAKSSFDLKLNLSQDLLACQLFDQ